MATATGMACLLAISTLPERVIKTWFTGRRLPALRKLLADLCRRHDPYDPNMERMARKLEQLGPLD